MEKIVTRHFFPDPFTNNTSIDLTNTSADRIRLMDLSGKVVMDEIVGNEIFFISGNKLHPGVYFYQITHEDQQIFNGKVTFIE
jgi:hypothetical protein